MNIQNLSTEERNTLLTMFRQFRVNDHEDVSDDYSNRDAIEQKLAVGCGELDGYDAHMLLVAVANGIPDHEVPSNPVFQHFMALFG